MNVNSFYPVILTPQVAASRDFYMTHFGFTLTFDADWYVSLKHPNGSELALLDPTHETIPANFRQPIQGGLILNFEVDDVDAEYARLIGHSQLPVLLDIRSEDFGQRHFITHDLNGVMIDVITNIPPSGDFAAQYVG